MSDYEYTAPLSGVLWVFRSRIDYIGYGILLALDERTHSIKATLTQRRFQTH